MSGYILCQVKKAGTPYYIESISTNIYTIEELCFYLANNVYLIDSTIMNEALCRWVEEELALPHLAQRLYHLLGKETSVSDFIMPVFKEINYLSYEELKSLTSRLDKLEKEPLYVRQKMKGDCLVENRMYVNAIKAYQRSLASAREKEAESFFMGTVFHNLGCAFSYLFQKEEALECFENAYGHLQTKESLLTYLAAFSTTRTPIEYESKLMELGVDSQMRAQVEEAVKNAWDEDVTVPGHNVDAMLERLTKEYHRSTGS